MNEFTVLGLLFLLFLFFRIYVAVKQEKRERLMANFSEQERQDINLLESIDFYRLSRRSMRFFGPLIEEEEAKFAEAAEALKRVEKAPSGPFKQMGEKIHKRQKSKFTFLTDLDFLEP
jgi:hypothetical protein